MSSTLSKSIRDQLNAIVYDKDDFDGGVDRIYSAMAKGIRDYIIDSTNGHMFVANTTGAIATAPTPTPVVLEPVTATMLSNDEATLKNNLVNIVKSGLSTGGVTRIFTAIGTWITAPPFNVTLTAQGPLVASILPPAPAPHSPIIFPTFGIQGPACEAEILGSTFDVGNQRVMEKQYWDIMAKHMQIALNANIIPPIPTNGLSTAGPPYTGLTTVVLTFK